MTARAALFILIFNLAHQSHAFDVSEIKKTLAQSKLSFSIASVPPENPDYPIVMVLQGFLDDQKAEPKKVIELLEPMLRRVIFQGHAGSGVRSYAVWRDLAYILLGRAYYESGDNKKARTYLQTFPEQSPFFHLAKAQMIWLAISEQDWTLAQTEIKIFEKLGFTSEHPLSAEITLQKAYIFLKQKNNADAARLASSFTMNEPVLENLRLRILAQAQFNIYQTSLQKSFAEKKSALDFIIGVASQVENSRQDSEFSYFMAEVFWHRASLLRVQDPSAYKAEITDSLTQADEYLKPHIDKSIKENKIILSEEALFLGAVVLWEQKKMDEAVPRLLGTIRLFPHTIYREDIYQLVADYYYDAGQFRNSIKYYSHLSSSGREEKASYGVYKAAWAFYNLNEKFKALRHLERLVVYQQNQRKKGNHDISLKVEAEKDMLLLLAELLPFNEANLELEIGRYEGEEWCNIREQLAVTYTKLGRSEEAVGIYKMLLEKFSTSERYQDWLAELLQNHLVAGQRKDIARSLDRYKDPARPPVEGSNLLKRIVRLQLNLHREGHKTDDPNVWSATDDLYNVTSKFLPELKDGEFWYFGAQRKEKLEKKSEAIQWYKKSAQTDDYENASDAALSVIRISSDMADKESLKKSASVEVYKKIAEDGQWFLERFEKLEQKSIAEKLYYEALYKSSQLERAFQYALRATKSRGADEWTWKNYLLFNRSLYDGKVWDFSYELSHQLLTMRTPPENLRKTIQEIRQESGFQRAFELEKINLPESRKWYLRVIEYALDPELRLKSWHNMIVSHNSETESQLLIAAFEKFKNDFDLKSVALDDYDAKQMLHNIFFNASLGYSRLKNHKGHNDTLVTAAGYASDKKTADAHLLKALTGYGSWYQKEEFKKIWSRIQPVEIIQDESQAAGLVRILDLLDMKTEAWALAKSRLNEKTGVLLWVALRDLFAHAQKASAAVVAEIQQWILDNEKFTRDIEPLNEFWAMHIYADFQKSAEVWRQPSSQPHPAPLTAAAPQDQMKERLNRVTQILKTMLTQKDALKKYFIKGFPQIAREGVCLKPQITGSALEELSALENPAIVSSQWKAFLDKLEGKKSELLLLQEREKTECQTQTAELMWHAPLHPSPGPFCFVTGCWQPRDQMAATLYSWDEKNSNLSGLERLVELLKSGAWATADVELSELKDEEDRKLALALIRLAEDDRRTALEILLSIKKEEHRMIVEILKQRIKFANGYPGALDSIPAEHLPHWQRELASEPKS